MSIEETKRERHDICCGPYPPPAVWRMHGGARGSMMSLFLASLLLLLLSSPRNQGTQERRNAIFERFQRARESRTMLLLLLRLRLAYLSLALALAALEKF